MKRPGVLPGGRAPETWFEEGCWIQEWSNHPDDPDCSIARARVPAGARTRWHRLDGTAERYVVLEGHGRVEIGALVQDIGPGDVAWIPPGVRQRVQAGDSDLVFLAICTPRFRPEAYEDLEAGM